MLILSLFDTESAAFLIACMFQLIFPARLSIITETNLLIITDYGEVKLTMN